MDLTPVQYLLGAGAGTVVGFSLGLVGGGGSILAVPLIAYLVGVDDPHLAIGTAAFAVAANAASGLVHHARAGHVCWQIGGLFAIAGIIGAWGGSSLGKQIDGQALLALFALLMLVVAGLMFQQRRSGGDERPRLSKDNAGKLALGGVFAGAASGFFGIGGGFLIVPALINAARLPILFAIGTSLLAVTSFGLTTAVNYARAGWVDWPLAGSLFVGGLLGGRLGMAVARRLSLRRGVLNSVFAALITVVALYMFYRSGSALGLFSGWGAA